MPTTDEKRAYNRQYYSRNKERLLQRQHELDTIRAEEKREYNRERYYRNRSELQARMREYYSLNKEKAKARASTAYAANRSRYIERALRREGKIKHGKLWTTPAEQAEIDGMYLFTDCFPWFEVDHIVPLHGETVSGLHVLGNLQVLARAQNRVKGNKFCPAVVELVQAIRN